MATNVTSLDRKLQRDSAKQTYGSIAGNRWIQLVCGVIAMILISNYQYAFTLFTPGMKLTFPGVPYHKIAAVFSAFILFETWPMPVAGYFVDKFGIRRLMMVGAMCIGLGWVLGGTIAKSPVDLYLYYGVIAGTGAGNYLHFLRCQRLEVVSGPSGIGCWAHSRRLRGGSCPRHHAHRRHDPQYWMGARDGHLGPRPGHHCSGRSHDPSPSPRRLGSSRVGPEGEEGK